MLSSISYKKIFRTIILVVGIFFAFSNQSFAQVSTEPLHVTGISQFDIYPWVNQTNPGFCILTSFQTDAPTSVVFRKAPLSTIDNPTWVFSSNILSGQSPSFGANIETAAGYQPATEYMVQFLELGPDGSHHLITPNNLVDDIKTMCTPNMDGTVSSTCSSNVPVVTECSSSGVNQALQNFGQSLADGVSIENIIPSQNGVTFNINTQNINTGQNLTVLYSTNLSHITGGNFSSAQSVFLTSNQDLLTVNLGSLLPNTTYYVTVMDQAGYIIIDTPLNQAYETFSTGTTSSGGNSNGSSGGGAPNPGTINVNLQGEFGQTELADEDIDQGFTQCGYGETYDCDFNQLLATIDRVIKFVIYVIVLPLAAILFAWSGIKLIIAQSKGKSAALSDAKSMFGRVLLGLVFALGAWVIVKFVLVIFGYTDASGLLSQILGITTTQ